MPRVKGGVRHAKRRRALMKRVKGFGAGRKNRMKLAKVADTHAGMHAYRGRKAKKREFRRLWNVRINAAVRPHGLSYSAFMGRLKTKGIALDRKTLSEIARTMPNVFNAIVESVK